MSPNRNLHHALRAFAAMLIAVVSLGSALPAKAADPKHVVENSVGGDPDLRLTVAELARIDAAFPLGPRPTVLPAL